MNIEGIHPDDQQTFEQIFDVQAKKTMIQWNIDEFKKVYPLLFQTIIISMNAVSKKNNDHESKIKNY